MSLNPKILQAQPATQNKFAHWAFETLPTYNFLKYLAMGKSPKPSFS